MIARTVRPMLVWTAALALAGGASAQQPAEPPVRPLGPITAVAAESLASVTAAVPVSAGRVYVNDISARRLLLFDSALARATVVADTSGEREAYGSQPGTLLPFHGDSALFISPSSLSMLVLSPEGTVARVMAMPPAGRGLGVLGLIGSIFGTPAFDARGRLVYYQPVNITFRGPPPSGGAFNLQPPDSAMVVRFDFAARALDTVGAIRIPRTRTLMSRNDAGLPSGITIFATPPGAVDDWAVTSDGAIALVRGRDYHVDWLGADGAWSSTPRMAFGWEHLDDAQKNALLDSLQSSLQTVMDSNFARQQRATAGGAQGPGAAAGGGGAPMIVTMRVEGGPPGGGGAVPGGSGGEARTTRFSMPRATVARAELADAPDYRPAFSQGAVRADADARLWIRTSARVNGQPVYDLVGRQGAVVDRLQLPPFRTIAGFGPGVVYLAVRDSSGVTHLERARIR